MKSSSFMRCKGAVFTAPLHIYYTTFCSEEQDLEILRAFAIVESLKKGGGVYYGK